MALGQSYTNKEYKKIAKDLRIELFNAQRACIEKKIPVVIILSGIKGSGRGKVANFLSEWLDAKFVRNHAFLAPSDEEETRPTMWRYWRHLPAGGETAVFFGAWYTQILRNSRFLEKHGKESMLESINASTQLEETLSKSGTAILKIWLHLSKEEHDIRRKYRKQAKENLYYTPNDELLDDFYDEIMEVLQETIPQTDKAYAPWAIIDAYDENYRNISVARALLQHLNQCLAAKEVHENIKEATQKDDNQIEMNTISALDRVDLSQNIEKEDYKEKLEELQTEVARLTFEAYQKGISTTLVFEGWDAGGKGGAIRRLSTCTDARITRVIPISSPTSEELAHHYLWRFWRHVPQAGYITIYDRSWYGRVLVERVEGFAQKHEWRRAYNEINAFEKELVSDKNIVIKFWLHISSEEQLRRFKEREDTPWKQHKITAEDWRNRDAADAYKLAADEMFLRTNTSYAPWYIIPAESKLFARIEVLRIYRDSLKNALSTKQNIKVESVDLLPVQEIIEENESVEKEKKDKKKKKEKKEK